MASSATLTPVPSSTATISPKQLRVRPRITVAGRRFKRYHVNADGSEIAPAIQEAAYAFVPKLVPDFEDSTEPAGFIVLHQGPNGVYLNVYCWVWDNVVHVRAAVAGEPYFGCQPGNLTDFTEVTRPLVGCTWELAALAHEPAAWVRHVFGAEEPDADAYLADVLPEGPVGDGTR